jgi:hypothetical protein
MQPVLKPHLSTLERVSLKDAAELLGLTESGARARFRRGELQGERDNTGKIWVYVAPAMQVAVQPAKQPHKSSDNEASRELAAVLKDQLAAITAERDTYRAAANETTRTAAELAGLREQCGQLENQLADVKEQRDRWQREADSWRQQATALLADHRPEPVPVPPPRRGLRGWLHRITA